jgi:hypothetical protein
MQFANARKHARHHPQLKNQRKITAATAITVKLCFAGLLRWMRLGHAEFGASATRYSNDGHHRSARSLSRSDLQAGRKPRSLPDPKRKFA